MSLGFLIDLIPAKQRKIVYGVLAVAVFLYGLWEASNGNWGQFVVSLVTASVGTLATANTNVQASPEGEATVPTVEDRVEAGENPDQSETVGKHAAPEATPEELLYPGDTEPPRYYS